MAISSWPSTSQGLWDVLKVIVWFMRCSQRCWCGYWCSLWFSLLPWRWKQHVSPNRWYLYTNVLYMTMTLVGLFFEQLQITSRWITRSCFPIKCSATRSWRERYVVYATRHSVRHCVTVHHSARSHVWHTPIVCPIQCMTFVLVCSTFRRLSRLHNHSRVSAVVT